MRVALNRLPVGLRGVIMGRSLRLFTVRGIDVKLHITFPLILLLAALQFGAAAGSVGGALFGIIAISILFVLVTLHELGHSFAAQHYGVEVKQIVLSPIGGVAQLAEIPDDPRQELVISAAGPAVNFVVAALMAVFIPLFSINLTNPLGMMGGQVGIGADALFSYIFVYNIFLAVFNLIPAFPLDGGRIFRALLALRLDYVRATEIASRIGRALAVFLGLYGLATGGLFLALIAVFIFMAAGQEAAYVRNRRALRGYTVQEVYSPSVLRLEPSSSLQHAANLMLVGRQTSFPVVVGDELVGFLPYDALMDGLQRGGAAAPVEDIMRRDVESVTPADELVDVSKRMEQARVDALPVISAGRFLGLVSQAQIDMLKRLASASPNVTPRPHAA
jgi:stage IV sporulation protein FB